MRKKRSEAEAAEAKRRAEEETRNRRQAQEEQDKRTRQEEADRKMYREIEYCKILEIPIYATLQMIKDAYRRLALLYHPDRNPDRWLWANQMMTKLNDAYEHVKLTAAK